ncbi:MAG: TonB-dependent receptor [Sphingobium sp.]
MALRPRLNIVTMTSFAALAASLSVPAYAQDDSGLGDIIVTARKVSENLQNVPVAVTVQTGDALTQQSAVRIPDIARLTPGITFSSAASTATASSITIRGQVQTDVLATLDPSVGTYVDGFYWARAYGLNADLLDIQSAQVLRGPQGTLFGRNTTGGALLLQTNDPNYNGVSGSISATYGRFNERIGTAIINVPLIEDKLAVRGAFTINQRDGFFTNLNTGKKLGERNSYTGRLKVLANPTENFSLLFSGELYRTNALTRPYQTQYVGTASRANWEAAVEANPANAALLATPAGQATLDTIGGALWTSYINSIRGTDNAAPTEDPRSYAKTQTYTMTANLDTFFGAVKFIGGYRKIDSNANIDLEGSPFNIVRTLGQQKLESYSGELQINGKAFGDFLDFASGLYVFEETGRDQSTAITLPALSALSAPLTRAILSGDVTNRSMGMYFQGTFHLTDKLSAIGGLRYSVEDKNLVSFNRTVNAATGALVSCSIGGADPTTCRIERHATYDGISYTAGLNYQFTPEVLGYIKAGKGFRSGGQNLRASGAAGSVFVPFKPEVSREEEIGLKTELFDRRVRFNLAAFYSEVTDIQRTTLVVGPTTTATIVGNAGKARFYGGEVELTARLFDGFTLSGNAALADAKYLKYSDDLGDKRDEAFTGVPKWTFAVAGDYETQLGLGKLNAHLDYAWQGKSALYNFRNNVTGVALTDAITRSVAEALTRKAGGELNGRLGVTLENGVELAVYGRNILNRRYGNTGLLFPAPLSVASTQRNDPVTYGVTATYKFGA